jgi:hypothetical protein
MKVVLFRIFEYICIVGFILAVFDHKWVLSFIDLALAVVWAYRAIKEGQNADL